MSDNGRARVIFSTGSLYLFDLAYTFELAAEAGYDGVEVMCDERWSTRDPDYLRRLSAAHALPILALHTPFSARTPGWRDQYSEIDRIGHTVRLAEAVGAETIIVHLPRKRGRVTINLLGRQLRLPYKSVLHPVKTWIETTLPARQAATRVRIALENMPSYYVAGVEIDPAWWNTVETWHAVHTWLTLDTTHWATQRVDPLDAFRAAAGRVAHIHLSNYNGKEHQLPQKGNLNLRTFLRGIAHDGFTGTVSLEVNPFVLGFKEPHLLRRNLRECAEFMRAGLG